ncbi:MAG: hypothetical protein HY820_25440 [Acidobacteria bacterium]|nr:hypothetical protein [Acidobacteriota bacterium]
MMRKAVVLIVSTKVDAATDDVVQRLARQGIPHHRLNTEEYPFHRRITYNPSDSAAWLQCDDEPLMEPTSIWYRRMRIPSTPERMDEGVATFCRNETRATILGSIIGQEARWMSHPADVWAAEFKPYQLRLAASLGLRIPPTVITNDPAIIRARFRAFGSMVIKPTRSGHVVKDGADHAIYTSQLLESHLDELDSARWSPSIYQALIPKRYDVRVTFVGERCFAAAIDSQTDPAARIDWRQTDNPELPHHPIQLPGDLEAALHRLMRLLSLTFGAIDLVLTPSGEYVFLEVNPSGQWLWLDDMLHLGITDAVADWLTETSTL